MLYVTTMSIIHSIICLQYQIKDKKYKYHFLLGELDTPLAIDWSRLGGGGMNLTLLRLVDYVNTTARNTYDDINWIIQSQKKKDSLSVSISLFLFLSAIICPLQPFSSISTCCVVSLRQK